MLATSGQYVPTVSTRVPSADYSPACACRGSDPSAERDLVGIFLALDQPVQSHFEPCSSNRSLCFRETEFYARRLRRRNIPEKFTKTPAETKLTPSRSASWAVVTGWPGNLLGSRNAWWRREDSNCVPSTRSSVEPVSGPLDVFEIARQQSIDTFARIWSEGW
jgi:hypothetical protein